MRKKEKKEKKSLYIYECEKSVSKKCVQKVGPQSNDNTLNTPIFELIRRIAT